MGRRWMVLGATTVAVAFVVAGCGGAEVVEPAEPTTTVTAPSTTSEPVPPSSVPTEEEAVLAAYQGYWDTWLVANDPPDPDHPDLARYATGAALERARESIINHRLVGQVLRHPVPSQSAHLPEVLEITGETARLSDCSIDDGLVIDAPTGRVLNDAIVTWSYLVDLVRSGGTWRVSSVMAVDSFNGVGTCGRS